MSCGWTPSTIYRSPREALPFCRGLLEQVKRATGKPILLTLRSSSEQGRRVPAGRRLSDKERVLIVMPLLPHVALVDVELSAKDYARRIVRAARRAGANVIGSFHDFCRTPRAATFNALRRHAAAIGVDLLKLAVTPRRERDVEELLFWGNSVDKPKLAMIAMGALGRMTRIAGYSFGSILTFGHLGRSGAPGQIPVSELCRAVHSIYPRS